MKKVYFENSRGHKRLIGESNDEKAVAKIIQAFLDARNYKSYYTRTWTDEQYRYYDVGSHTEFFLWEL